MIIAVGTKGMLIKTAGIIHELDSRGITYQYVNFGQHGPRMPELNKLFGLKPFDIDLSKYHDIASVKEAAPWFIEKLWSHKSIITENGPIVIQGDTQSTLLGCIIGKLHNLKIAHVEAGLRSYNIFNPFPEELIRRIVTRNSDILFPPSNTAYKALIEEKISAKIINTMNNTVLDSVKMALEEKQHIPYNDYVLVSIHRIENLYSKKRMKIIIDTINNIDNKIIWPLHQPTKNYIINNPNISLSKNIVFLPLQDYFTFIHLIKNALFIITDGGGPQEEASILGTPCLLMRDKTERNDGIGLNVILSRFDKEKINLFIDNYESFRSKEILNSISPSKIIVDSLEAALSK